MLAFKTIKMLIKRKFCNTKEEDDVPYAKFTHSTQNASEKDAEESMTEKEGICFICDKPAPVKYLQLAMTLPLEEMLQHVINLLDEKLLAKLSAGDTVS